MFEWVYCYDGNNLPESWETKVCLFGPNVAGGNVSLKSCVLVEPLELALDSTGAEEEGIKRYWIVRGDVSGKEVFPYAWLKIHINSDPELMERLRKFKTASYVLRPSMDFTPKV